MLVKMATRCIWQHVAPYGSTISESEQLVQGLGERPRHGREADAVDGELDGRGAEAVGEG
jgi:hypothetical protein